MCRKGENIYRRKDGRLYSCRTKFAVTYFKYIYIWLYHRHSVF